MKYSNYIMRCVRQNLGLEPNDTSRDKEILTMTPREVFDKWLEWQGIIGYGEIIISAIENIFNVKFKE